MTQLQMTMGLMSTREAIRCCFVESEYGELTSAKVVHCEREKYFFRERKGKEITDKKFVYQLERY